MYIYVCVLIFRYLEGRIPVPRRYWIYGQDVRMKDKTSFDNMLNDKGIL